MQLLVSGIALSLALYLVDPAAASAQTIVKEYQFVGVTSAFHTGNIGGIPGVLDACREDFPASRMCSASEIWRTMTWPAGTFTGWGWVTNVNPNALGGDQGWSSGDTCENWSTSSGSITGTAFRFNFGFEGARLCSMPTRIACCALLPVPEPPTSLVLPAGASALMAFARLRGVSLTHQP